MAGRLGVGSGKKRSKSFHFHYVADNEIKFQISQSIGKMIGKPSTFYSQKKNLQQAQTVVEMLFAVVSNSIQLLFMI